MLPEVYQRGMDCRNPGDGDVVHRTAIEPAQYASPLVGPAVGGPLPPGTRRVRAFPRGDVPVQAQWIPNPQTNEWVAIIESGVNFIVDGVDAKLGVRGGKELGGSIDVSADRMVIWTRGQREPDLSGGTAQDERTPLELYMEGNVVFRQGERVIYASRMYYDVSNKVGTVLDAELLTPAPSTRAWCDCTPRSFSKSAPTASWPRTPLSRQPHGRSRLSPPGQRRDV